MKSSFSYPLAVITMAALFSCSPNGEHADAFGNFESDETTISAEATGKLLRFTVREGVSLHVGDTIGIIDTTQLYLKKRTMMASIRALQAKTINVQSEIDVLLAQKQNINRELNRIHNLVQNNAATRQQLDDLNGQLRVIENQINASEIRLSQQNRGLLSEIQPLEWQIRQINDQIKKSVLINPLEGVVLSKFVYENELVSFGTPLYKIADLSHVHLRAYLEEPQLASVKIGSRVRVAIDKDSEIAWYSGTIAWISETSEFTPKTIQTRSERANLVFALKVAVENDGAIKLGMPGEMWINHQQ